MFFYYPLGGGGSSALAVTIIPPEADLYVPSNYGTASIDVSAAITGGTPPFDVQWRRVLGDSNIIPGSFEGADNYFYANNDDALPHVFTATWRATVTDALSATATADVDITLAFGTAPS